MNISANNEQAEQALLAAILIDPWRFPEVADTVTASDFYSEAHRVIWESIVSVESAGHQPDLITVTQDLRASGNLTLAGGAKGISFLVDVLPDVGNIMSYADIIKTEATSRQLARAIAKVRHESDPVVAVESLQESLDMMSQGTATTTVSLGDSANDVALRAGDLAAGRAQVQGYRSGFDGLDKYITTLHPGELYILAARPSVGKTALACNLAGNVARAGGRVLFASLEMSHHELTERMISTESAVDTRSFRSGVFNLDGVPNDIERTVDTAKVFQEWDMFIDDRSSLSAQQIRALSRKVQARHGLDLVVVDYLQLMTGSGNNRNDIVGNISRSMKCLSKDLGVPVVVLSQLSRRPVEEGRAMRPRLSDLRDSGNIEQDADKVMFLVRDKEEAPRIAQLQLAKNRQGPIGDVPLSFEPAHSKFEDGSWEDWTNDEE